MVNPDELQEMIEANDLTGDLALVKDLCGIGVARVLATKLSGVNLYISDAPLKPGRIRLANKLIKKGWSHKRIAAYLGVSERWLYSQLKGKETTQQQLLFYGL